MNYELAERLKARIAEDQSKGDERAEVKDLKLCRECRIPLTPANSSGASGYQCIECKRRYQREYMAHRRAAQKATQPT